MRFELRQRQLPERNRLKDYLYPVRREVRGSVAPYHQKMPLVLQLHLRVRAKNRPPETHEGIRFLKRAADPKLSALGSGQVSGR